MKIDVFYHKNDVDDERNNFEIPEMNVGVKISLMEKNLKTKTKIEFFPTLDGHVTTKKYSYLCLCAYEHRKCQDYLFLFEKCPDAAPKRPVGMGTSTCVNEKKRNKSNLEMERI
jgi:hypothetical protein